MVSLTLRAYAKINLSLRVKGTRADGYHDVQTILQGIDLFDRLTISPRRGPFVIRCDRPGVPLDSRNLIWKAAALLMEAAGMSGTPRNAVVSLQKNIPMEAGLGGGSADAAAALLGLRRLWKLELSDEALLAVAAGVGSDVPYFFVGGTALALGRGEDVYPLEDLPPLWVVLVCPPFGVSTGEAYAWLDARRFGDPLSAMSHDNGSGIPFRGRSLRNDLEEPVIERHPVIGAIKARLAAGGAVVAAMSGSGSTVFGVFESARKARAAARSAAKDGARVLTTRFRPRRRARRLPARASID